MLHRQVLRFSPAIRSVAIRGFGSAPAHHDDHGHDHHHDDLSHGPRFGPTTAFPVPIGVVPSIVVTPEAELLRGKKLHEESELWQDDGRAIPEYFIDVTSNPLSLYFKGECLWLLFF
jgi:hypothetical protein